MDFENSKIDTAHSEHELLFDDPKTARKRARADKRRRRKYKFTDKKHSRSGLIATILVIFLLPAILSCLDRFTGPRRQRSRQS